MHIEILKALRSDMPVVKDLLIENTLPPDGLEHCFDDCIVAMADDSIVGAVTFEHNKDTGMLRSLVVAKSWHAQGIGKQLYEAIVERAKQKGITAFYLMTTTAETYFDKLGFETLEREQAPDAIKNSVQFTTACPDSAVLMVKRI